MLPSDDLCFKFVSPKPSLSTPSADMPGTLTPSNCRNQVLEFALDVRGNFRAYDFEGSAWPGIMDKFVEWQQKRLPADDDPDDGGDEE